MTPARLTALHAAAFPADRPWSADEFETLLSSPYVRLYPNAHGFALTRTLAGESELLTLAVDPLHRRKGIGGALLSDWLGDIAPRAERAFLEVAADNPGAVALYRRAGFEQIARRKGYYARPDADPVDALILQWLSGRR